MTDKTVTVTLPLDVAERYVAAGFDSDIAKAIKAALPPEYAEGTVAWVTRRTRPGVTERRLCVRAEDAARYGGWYLDPSKRVWFSDDSVEKVEPLRVLADDEIAVKRGDIDARHIRGDLEADAVGAWLLSVADALEAEERRNV